jgi:hypothetical protein
MQRDRRPLSKIIRGVNQIRKWLPEAGLANVRLHPGPHRSLEVEQAGGRTDKNGQFVLAIDGSQHSPDELFGQAGRQWRHWGSRAALPHPDEKRPDRRIGCPCRKFHPVGTPIETCEVCGPLRGLRAGRMLRGKAPGERACASLAYSQLAIRDLLS